MSWAYGIVDGREVGYSVVAECDHPECSAEIDRGLSYKCKVPGETDYGCGGFFCPEHGGGYLCDACWRVRDECERLAKGATP